MSLEDMFERRIVGIRAFNDLPIDADVWNTAHNHHHQHRQLHAVAAHRPGIVYGLEVIASTSNPATVVVAPGLAIDSEGRTLVVRRPEPFTFSETGTSYITLSFQTAQDSGSAITVGGGQEYYREIESRKLVTTKTAPKAPVLELARIYRSRPDAPIRDATNPSDPARDEIDQLQRQLAFPHCYADTAIGEIGYVPKNSDSSRPNRAGLINLLREASGRGFHLDFSGVLPLGAGTPALTPALVYMAGRSHFQSLADAEVESLRRYLEGGGMLLAEAASSEFEKDFRALAGSLGANLEPVGKGNQLLNAHYIFAAPPPGARESGDAGLFADLNAGVVFSTRDYGGAWQGDIEKPNGLDARERIRQSVEFGLNVIAYAARRLRLRDLAKLG